jgi:CRISPR-associated endonuclease/helicase Cas3
MRKKFEPRNKEKEVISYKNCIAKTYYGENGQKQLGRTVLNHCQIVGEVAKEIIQRSPNKALFPKGAAFTAASHDVGKISPTFQNKLLKACNLPLLPDADPEIEKNWNGHAGVSQLTASALNAPTFIPDIIGQHHGFSPKVEAYRAYDEHFGGSSWQSERENMLKVLQQVLDETWPEVDDYVQARLLAGLTTVSDWIGSGEFFEDPQADWKENIQLALDKAGFITPTIKQGLCFEDIFGFAPRNAQQLLIEQASESGIYILEAPMGLGKTEAALYVAYQLLEQGLASGIYFALPTQLTSNKIYERFQNFLEKILSDDCDHRALLLHANAWLVATEMGEEGQPGGDWFNQSKRGLLAPFAVGTIDQALMAAMNVKHGFVRVFGLAGKVVILDEVHSYDCYTGSLLDSLIQLLRKLDCTVVILSATLSQERRQGLLGSPTIAQDYPLITALKKDQTIVAEVSVPICESREIAITLVSNESTAIEEALLRAEQGQQVLWIENTVKNAQTRFLDLAARANDINIECGLVHSKYTFEDRQSIEGKWVNLFGKHGWERRISKGRILIGTQVLEQSIDIDADFLITGFAPTDMLLQRFGRLWRHHGTPRPKGAEPDAWIIAPVLENAIEEPQSQFGPSSYVYSPYVLCRSLEAWQNKKMIRLPEDIRGLIEATYVSRIEQNQMVRWKRDLEEGTKKRIGQTALKQLARVALAETGSTLPECKAQTRYSETESVQVLVLKRLQYDNEKKAGILYLCNGEVIELPQNRMALNKQQWREVTAKLTKHIVHVRTDEAPVSNSISDLQRFGLHHCFYMPNSDWAHDESNLRVVLVDEADQLVGLQQQPAHSKYVLEYRKDLGYRMIKNRNA